MCVARRQVCVARGQVCVARWQLCVAMCQGCVARPRWPGYNLLIGDRCMFLGLQVCLCVARWYFCVFWWQVCIARWQVYVARCMLLRDNSFSTNGPRLFNLLPKELKGIETRPIFKSRLDKFLKTFLDTPPTPGYVALNNNSLLDWAACGSLRYSGGIVAKLTPPLVEEPISHL